MDENNKSAIPAGVVGGGGGEEEKTISPDRKKENEIEKLFQLLKSVGIDQESSRSYSEALWKDGFTTVDKLKFLTEDDVKKITTKTFDLRVILSLKDEKNDEPILEAVPVITNVAVAAAPQIEGDMTRDLAEKKSSKDNEEKKKCGPWPGDDECIFCYCCPCKCTANIAFCCGFTFAEIIVACCCDVLLCFCCPGCSDYHRDKTVDECCGCEGVDRCPF